MTVAGTTCLIATVKDEGPWLLEWVAHNRAIGFDRIVVASNDCSDGTDEMLDRMDALGILRHLPNPVAHLRNNAQVTAYQQARFLPEVATADWLIALDADEFLNIKRGNGTLPDLLATVAPETEAVTLVWRLFGDAGRRGWIEGPLSDALTLAASEQANQNYVKILSRRHQRYPGYGAHGPRFPDKWPQTARYDVRLTDAMGRPFPPDKLVNPGHPVMTVRARRQCWDVAQINHYMVKTPELYRLKTLRGDPYFTTSGKTRYTDETYRAHNCNDEADTSIQRSRAARSAELDRLLADEVLSALHERACEQAKAEMERLAARPASPRPRSGLARKIVGRLRGHRTQG